MPATEIAIAIVEQDGCLLVGKRPFGVPFAGLWEFPGGKVGPNESPERAAVRECLEETGLTVKVVLPLPVVDYEYSHGRLRLHFFLCRPADEDPPAPRPPFIWAPRLEALALEFPAANAMVIEWLRGHSS